MIFLFLQCVSTVIIVYIIISLLNSYLYIHWILDFNFNTMKKIGIDTTHGVSTDLCQL